VLLEAYGLQMDKQLEPSTADRRIDTFNVEDFKKKNIKPRKIHNLNLAFMCEEKQYQANYRKQEGLGLSHTHRTYM